MLQFTLLKLYIIQAIRSVLFNAKPIPMIILTFLSTYVSSASKPVLR